MSCSPWLLALRVESELRRDLEEFLGYKLEFKRLSVNAFYIAVLCLDHLFHLLLEVFANDIYYFTEAGLNCVIDRIVDDSLSVWTESVHLFQSTVAASHSGCKYQKCRFHV